MRVFLAGATGVIGSPLVHQLLDAEHEVTAMTRSVLRATQLEAAGAEPVVCDVFDADGVRAAVADAAPEAIVHQLTALPPRLDWGDPALFDAHNRVRSEGGRILVDAALATGARRFVAQSIAFAYAPTGDWVKDEDAALAIDARPPLGAAIAAGVDLERLVKETAGLEGVVLRYGMLYGPGTYHDRRGSTALDIRAARVPLIEGATERAQLPRPPHEGPSGPARRGERCRRVSTHPGFKSLRPQTACPERPMRCAGRTFPSLRRRAPPAAGRVSV